MVGNLIQIKRSATNAVIPTLANGELAFTQANNILYIGAPDGSGNIPIATKLNPGVLTANQVLVANTTSGIDKVIVANLVPTKIYANGAFGTGNQVLASNTDGSVYWLSVGSIGINVDSQYVWTNTHTFQNVITFNSTINGTANNANYLGGTIASSFQLNSTLASNVATLTANLATYIVANTGLVSNASGVFVNATYIGSLSSNNTTYINGNTAGDLNTYASDKAANAYSNAMSDTLSRSGSYTGNNTFGGTNTVFNSNVALAGVVSFTGSVNTAINPTANGTQDLGTSDKRWGKLYLAGSTIVLGNTTLSSTGNALQTDNLIVTTNATINTIIGTLTTISSNVNFTGANIDMTSALLNVRDATVSGNLIINGTLTTVNTNSLQVKDSNIAIATNNTVGDTIDFGFYGTYKSGATQYYSGLFRDHSISTATNPYYHLFAATIEPTHIVDTSSPGYTQGTLASYLDSGAFVANSTAVNITANSTVSSAIVANSISLTTALAASYGGTGQSSYNAGDLLYASGSTTLSKLSVPGSVANGQVLQIVNNLPAYGTLDAGTF